MSEPLTPAELAEMAKRHRRSPYAHSSDCDICRQVWPCDASRLLAERDRVTAAVEKFRAESAGMPSRVILINRVLAIVRGKQP